MRRIIKVTEAQLRITEGDLAYSYIEDEENDTPHNSQTQISAQGYIDDAEYGGPLTTDQAGDVMTPQHWYRGYRGTAATTFAPNMDTLEYDRHPYITESDSDNDGIDDFYEVDVDTNNHPALDALSDDDNYNDSKSHNDDEVISETIQRLVDKLIVSLNGIASKYQVKLLQKIIKNLSMKNIPYSWNNTLQRKMRMRNNVTDNNLNQNTEVDVNNGITPTTFKLAERLIHELNNYSDQKKAIVINKLIETLDVDEVPFQQTRKTVNSIANQQQKRFR